MYFLGRRASMAWPGVAGLPAVVAGRRAGKDPRSDRRVRPAGGKGGEERRAVDRARPSCGRVRPSARPEPIPNLRSGIPEGGARPDGGGIVSCSGITCARMAGNRTGLAGLRRGGARRTQFAGRGGRHLPARRSLPAARSGGAFATSLKIFISARPVVCCNHWAVTAAATPDAGDPTANPCQRP